MPRKPWVSLREIKITGKTASHITGEAVFHLDSAMMNAESDFDTAFNVRDGALSWGERPTRAPATARHRVVEWSISNPCCTPGQPTHARITGRASADNRWPLGLEFEPFKFKTVKVGQKLKFKQFPVSLPQ